MTILNILFLLSKIIKKVHIPAIRDSKLDKKAKVCSGSHIVKTNIDRYSYVGNYCTVINAEIGSFCSIADNCIIGGASHPIHWVSTSPVFHEGKNVMKKNFSSHNFKTGSETIIGHDVWIGNNCLIKSGVEIGDGAIIGMGSVLTKDVGNYEIWAGNPAKFIRKRFDDKTIKDLQKSKWWKWDDRTLTQKANYFCNVEEFLSKGNKK